MNVAEIKTRMKEIADTTSVYLLEILSDTSGFFTNDGKLLFIARDIYNYSHEGIETDYLKLQTHVRISSVKNNQSFKDDYYNIIIYKADIENSNVTSFMELCSVYSDNSEELNFKDFFYSLIALFQLPREQSFKNIVGLYGELKFMEYVYRRTGTDISLAWHKRGPYSKYDFSNGEKKIEIKTTVSDDLTVTIKHKQIFDRFLGCLVVVTCDQDEGGETVEELIDIMHEIPDAFNGVNFSINLAKELKRVSESDCHELKFIARDFFFLDTIDINPFPELPEEVSELVYKLDVSEMFPLSTSESDKLLREFCTE